MADEMIVRVNDQGEVEVEVRGVKGKRCTEVSKAITDALGQVASSVPTEEMDQQEVSHVRHQNHNRG